MDNTNKITAANNVLPQLAVTCKIEAKYPFCTFKVFHISGGFEIIKSVEGLIRFYEYRSHLVYNFTL